MKLGAVNPQTKFIMDELKNISRLMENTKRSLSKWIDKNQANDWAVIQGG
ncbi:hypothetical protein ACP70R_003805 [Stipagrostis hirtigluma subsp. patula]